MPAAADSAIVIQQLCTTLHSDEFISELVHFLISLKDPEGANCHEFPAMVRQLLVKLGVGAATTPTPLGGHVITPTADWRQQLVDQDALLARKDAELAAQAKELQSLRASLASSEHDGHTQTTIFAEEGVPDERIND